MLCSVCKKNVAVIFINKLGKDGKPEANPTGLCIECAKKQGIDPVSNIMNQMGNISDADLNNMSEQFESMLSDMDISDVEDLEVDENGQPKNPFSIGKLFGFFPSKNKKDTSELKSDSAENDSNKSDKKTKSKKDRKTKYLDTFGENLTRKARNGELDKVIGRKEELERLIEILNRRSKNNPALIGEPGVGKTAIVNALALEIAAGNVPAKLINKEVYLIDMTSLVAGTQFRGQFEARIKGIIDECKSFGNIILAIDEVHNIVGGLEHDNSMNAANMLKPALANGSVQLIGATTLKEYRKYIEKDSALERRFQPVIVDEPTKKDCIEILNGIKEYYENYHKVKISDEIVKQAVYLSDKYIHDRFLPDKAIDLIDEACARVNLENVVLSKLEKLESSLEEITCEEKELEEDMQNIDDAKDENNTKVQDTQNYEKAAKLKESKCKIETQIKELKKQVKPSVLDIDHLARVIELWTKIPVSKIKEEESAKLLNLNENLNKRIIGQENATKAISNAILRKRSGIIDEVKPPSFIFVGPTGVGKTALVKRLAYELFDTEDNVIKLDMSEYMESHSVSKLIGSPPGYVGYDDAGQLTEKVRRNPYSIILFDEIEKAHPSVSNMLLQILDEGKLTDSQGRSVSFKHTIIILTSNLGTNFRSDNYGFTSTPTLERDMLQNKVNDALKEYFSPEFLNRIDDIIVFNKLSHDNIVKIASILLDELKEQTSQKDILFDYTNNVLEFIVNKGYNDKFGARPLKRAIQKYIEDLLSIEFIKKNITPNVKFTLDVENNNIIIK